MNTRYYMVIIKGKIKTSEIMSCVYNRNTQKWDVKFNNGKTYSYAYLNVEKLTLLISFGSLIIQDYPLPFLMISPYQKRTNMDGSGKILLII